MRFYACLRVRIVPIVRGKRPRIAPEDNNATAPKHAHAVATLSPHLREFASRLLAPPPHDPSLPPERPVCQIRGNRLRTARPAAAQTEVPAVLIQEHYFVDDDSKGNFGTQGRGCAGRPWPPGLPTIR